MLCCRSSSRCDINLIKHVPITSHDAGADQKTAPKTTCCCVCCATPFALHRFAIGCHHHHRQPSNRTRLKSPHCVSVGLTHPPFFLLSLEFKYLNNLQINGKLAAHTVWFNIYVALLLYGVCLLYGVSGCFRHTMMLLYAGRVLHEINIKQRVLLLLRVLQVPHKNVTKSLSLFCFVGKE